MNRVVLAEENKKRRYIAGITFSNTVLRYICFVQEKGSYRVYSYGEVKVPYDVIKDYIVQLPVEFTSLLRSLNRVIPTEALIVIKTDYDEHKSQSLMLAGYKHVHHVALPESLRSVALPHVAQGERVVIFGAWEQATLFRCRDYEFTKIGVVRDIDEKQLLSIILRDTVSGLENSHVVYLGKLEPAFEKNIQSYVTLERPYIFQNIISLSEHVPVLEHEDSFRYTVPTSLVAQALTVCSHKHDEPGDEITKRDDHTHASEYFDGMTPLTKLEEDTRKSSEKIRGRKYKKMMKSPS